MNIKRWVCSGGGSDLSEVKDTDELLEAGGDALDSACAYDIMGPVLFQGEDGEYYVGTVEFSIKKADPLYVKSQLENEQEQL